MCVRQVGEVRDASPSFRRTRWRGSACGVRFRRALHGRRRATGAAHAGWSGPVAHRIKWGFGPGRIRQSSLCRWQCGRAVDSAESLEHGRRIGTNVAEAVSSGEVQSSTEPPEIGRRPSGSGEYAFDTASTGKSFVCPCEDVTVGRHQVGHRGGFPGRAVPEEVQHSNDGPLPGEDVREGGV